MEDNTSITTNCMDEITDIMNKILETQKSISFMLVTINGMLLRHIQDPSDEYIIAALKQNGLSFTVRSCIKTDTADEVDCFNKRSLFNSSRTQTNTRNVVICCSI